MCDRSKRIYARAIALFPDGKKVAEVNIRIEHSFNPTNHEIWIVSTFFIAGLYAVFFPNKKKKEREK